MECVRETTRHRYVYINSREFKILNFKCKHTQCVYFKTKIACVCLVSGFAFKLYVVNNKKKLELFARSNSIENVHNRMSHRFIWSFGTRNLNFVNSFARFWAIVEFIELKWRRWRRRLYKFYNFGHIEPVSHQRVCHTTCSIVHVCVCV